jgi:hypothetical protein
MFAPHYSLFVVLFEFEWFEEEQNTRLYYIYSFNSFQPFVTHSKYTQLRIEKDEKLKTIPC